MSRVNSITDSVGKYYLLEQTTKGAKIQTNMTCMVCPNCRGSVDPKSITYAAIDCRSPRDA